MTLQDELRDFADIIDEYSELMSDGAEKVRRAADRLDALELAQEWQRIETAPRDWTPVLSWDGSQMAVVAYDARQKEWFLLEGGNEAHAECPIEWNFSHWTPLQPPPLPTPPGEG